MRKNDKKIFLDKAKLYQMVNLRLNGLSLTSLGYLFNCNLKSIEYQCDKYNVKPIDDTYTIERLVSKILRNKIKEPTYKVVNGEKINLGRSYKDYL